jgi:hypothetical protein
MGMLTLPMFNFFYMLYIMRFKVYNEAWHFFKKLILLKFLIIKKCQTFKITLEMHFMQYFVGVEHNTFYVYMKYL